MFSATRLNVFVCIALGLAANAAPAGLDSATNLGANANIANLANLGLTGNVGSSSSVNAPDIDSLIASLGLGVDAATGASVDRRQILEDIFGQGTDLINAFGLGGLSGGASASTGTTTDGTTTDSSTGASTGASASSLGSLFGSGGLGSFGGSSSTNVGTSFASRSDVEKRQILENLGLGTNLSLNDLLSQLGFFNTNAFVTASVSGSETVSVTATPTATGTLSIPTGSITLTLSPTTATATAGATASAGANANGFDLSSLLSQLQGGNFGNFGGNANVGAGANTNFGGFDLSQLGL